MRPKGPEWVQFPPHPPIGVTVSDVIEQHYSASRSWRALILLRRDGLFTVELEHWVVEEVDGHRVYEGWMPSGKQALKRLDSLDRVRDISDEVLDGLG